MRYEAEKKSIEEMIAKKKKELEVLQMRLENIKTKIAKGK